MAENVNIMDVLKNHDYESIEKATAAYKKNPQEVLTSLYENGTTASDRLDLEKMLDRDYAAQFPDGGARNKSQFPKYFCNDMILNVDGEEIHVDKNRLTEHVDKVQSILDSKKDVFKEILNYWKINSTDDIKSVKFAVGLQLLYQSAGLNTQVMRGTVYDKDTCFYFIKAFRDSTYYTVKFDISEDVASVAVLNDNFITYCEANVNVSYGENTQAYAEGRNASISSINEVSLQSQHVSEPKIMSAGKSLVIGVSLLGLIAIGYNEFFNSGDLGSNNKTKQTYNSQSAQKSKTVQPQKASVKKQKSIQDALSSEGQKQSGIDNILRDYSREQKQQEKESPYIQDKHRKQKNLKEVLEGINKNINKKIAQQKAEKAKKEKPKKKTRKQIFLEEMSKISDAK